MSYENIDTWEILYFKNQTIGYCLDKMREVYDNRILSKSKTVTGRDIREGAWLIACYGDFFFLEVTSFFDCLARHFTRNQISYKDINFQNWIEWQIKRNMDNNFIVYLNKQFKDWYEDFKKVRNKVAHLSHLYTEINEIMVIENGKIRTFTMDVNGKPIELLNYCNDIQKKLNNISDFIEENHYWNNRYDYKK